MYTWHSEIHSARHRRDRLPFTPEVGSQGSLRPKQTSQANPQALSQRQPRIRPTRSKPVSTIHSLGVLHNELYAAIFICSRPTIADIDRDIIRTVSPLQGMFPHSWDSFRDERCCRSYPDF